MGGMIAGVRPIDSGSEANPGLPFAASATSGIYRTASGGYGISLGGLGFFDLGVQQFTLGHRIAPTGILSQISASPYTTGGNGDRYCAVSPNGLWVASAALFSDLIIMYSRNINTGELTAVTGSPFASVGSQPYFLTFSPDSRFLYVATGSSHSVQVFSVSGTGALAAASGSPHAVGNSPFGIAFSAAGNHVYITSLNAVYGYSVNTVTGAWAAIAGSPWAVSSANSTTGVAISPNGAFVFTGTSGNSVWGVYAWSRNAATGALTMVSNSPFVRGGSSVRSLAVSPDSLFLYGSREDGSLDQWSINQSSGALVQLSTSPLALSAAYSVKISPDGALLYTAGGVTDKVHVFRRNLSTGLLTAIVGSPFTATGAFSVALSPDGSYLYVSNSSAAAKIIVFQTSATQTYPLVSVAFSPTYELDGVFNINGILEEQGSRVASQSYVTSSIATATLGLLDDRGNYNASGNTFPASGGSGTAGAIVKGDVWYVSVAGVLGSVAVGIGDTVRALVDTPGQTLSNWNITGSQANAVITRMSNWQVHGGGSLRWNTVAGKFSFDTGFNITGIGYGAGVATEGYFNVSMPGNGVALSVAGGASARNWTADGVMLNNYESLYYKLPIGQASTTVNANFYVLDTVSASANFYVPYDWVLIASAFPDGQGGTSLKIANGIILSSAGQLWTAAIGHAQATGDITKNFSLKNINIANYANGGATALATLVAGTVTVANANVTAASNIFLSAQETGINTGNLRVSARVPGVSFTITSTNVADTCTVAWLIVEPV